MSSNPVTALLPPAHPGEALTTDPADAGQHPEHPLPPTQASLQQRVTTPGMPRTDSTRRIGAPGRWRVHHARTGQSYQFWCLASLWRTCRRSQGWFPSRQDRAMPSCPLGHGPARPAPLNASARARAYYDQLRACGLSHCVALRRLGNRLAGAASLNGSMPRGGPAKLAGAGVPAGDRSVCPGRGPGVRRWPLGCGGAQRAADPNPETAVLCQAASGGSPGPRLTSPEPQKGAQTRTRRRPRAISVPSTSKPAIPRSFTEEGVSSTRYSRNRVR